MRDIRLTSHHVQVQLCRYVCTGGLPRGGREKGGDLCNIKQEVLQRVLIYDPSCTGCTAVNLNLAPYRDKNIGLAKMVLVAVARYCSCRLSLVE